ncbi:MAG: cadherin-like beta sandwich domain-containing protein [Lachnospiraceae bacterium]|nr:cadherin-like beta sandwich domain-containing protein [Lachnospiraceae bacterium]
MKRRKKICRTIAILLFSLAFIGGGFFHAGFFNVFADRDLAYELLLNQLGFPESYYEKLTALHREHPEWAFLPFQTGLTWEEALNGEDAYRLNLTPNTVNYPTSYHAVNEIEGHPTFDYDLNAFVIMSAPNWVQASREAIAYYMDPRNFLNSDEIFQFEYLASNPMIQTAEGVERILAGSFMAETYVTKPTLYIHDGLVTGIEPDTTKEDFLRMLACEPGKTIHVWNADHSEKEIGSRIGTGDLVTVSDGDLLWGAETLPEDYVEPAHMTYTCMIYGDTDGDGTMTKRDYLFFKRHYKGYYALEGPFVTAADGDRDGDIDNLDRLFVKRAAYGYYPMTQRQVNEVEKKTAKAFALYGADGQTYAECIMEISEEYGISPYMLAVRLRQEQGTGGTSSLISGTYEGFEGYYNYFNFGASGVTEQEIVENGLTYAKENGWNSPGAAIRGGAERIVEKYIAAGQFTLYLQKFNVIKNGVYAPYRHQYMQNLLAARNEAVRTARVYTELGCMDNGYIFYIPVYEDMPDVPAAKPVQDGNPNPYLQGIEVAGIETVEVTTPEETETSSEESDSSDPDGESVDESQTETEETETEPTLPQLNPAFDRKVFRYDIYVEENVKSISLDAQAVANLVDSPLSFGRGKKDAVVEGAGKKELEYGENTFSIRVTAGNGAVLTYEIHVFREIPETTPAAESEETGGAEEPTSGN